jgi:hypothetical protein
MNHKAIYKLYPTVVSIDDTAGAFDAQGNKVTIDLAAINSWNDPEEYKTSRKYPSIGDQLDMLWHAIDNGTLNKTSDFYTAIKAVKDAHPKSVE